MPIFHCTVVYTTVPFTCMGTVPTTWSLVAAREPQDIMKNLTKLTLADDQFLHREDNQ